MTEDQLRRAFAARAETVQVAPDALPLIRRQIARRRTWWWRLTHIPRGGAMFTLSTGGAVAAAAVVAAVLAGTSQCAPPTTTPPPVAGTSSVAPSPKPGVTSSRTNLAIYYIGHNNLVYREFHLLPAGDGSKAAQVKAAVTEMLDGRTALDPDYHSSWPASAAVRAVSVTGTSITVDLSGASVNAYDPPTEQAALQQLIWTATAAVPGSTMRLLLDGQPVAKLWNLLPTSGDLHRGNWLDVQAQIQVIDPQQGSVVGKTFTITVDGSAFEATAVVQVLDSNGAVVKEQQIHVGSVAVPNRATASVTLTLPAGTYTVKGFVRSAKDGSEQQLDDHTFTVK